MTTSTTPKQDQVLDALSVIIDPDLNQDIVSLGFIHDLVISDQGDVSFEMRLTTPACPVKEVFEAQAKEALAALDWVKTTTIKMGASAPKNALLKSSKGLENVGAVIAVSSCKGGVGKSSVAVNLAFQLSKSGAKVGIFDADVYGPSLPTMVECPLIGVMMEGQWILPFERHGVKLMSFGFVASSDSGPALMRGPMVSQVVNQLLTGTFWGELDYLIIDMPPGTGDIPITLSQLIPITAAVIVTTPQHISCIDVIKGIQMFDKLKIPVVSVVENMSYFICDNCEHRHHIYGEGALQTLTQLFGFSNTIQLPLDPNMALACDHGTPFILQSDTSPMATKIQELAALTAREVSKLKFGDAQRPILESNSDNTLSLQTQSAPKKQIPASVLRESCRCALCVDEWTMKKQVDTSQFPSNLHAKSIQLVGNYAYGISWSDGHSSLYPFDQLLSI